MKNKRKSPFLWLLLSLILILSFAGNGWPTQNTDEPCAVMRPDKETRLKWFKAYEEAPKAHIEKKFSIPLRGSCSLLSHLDYVPAERNQGYCGNCWAWAGTGVMEIALDVEELVFDRLSVQYHNSCGGTGANYGCCGGWLSDLADFYSSTGYQQALPWSNTNASWQDYGYDQRCGQATSVPCGSISASPNYPIDFIDEVKIETHGVGQATAIANIKNILHQNRGVWFGFFLATEADGDNFKDFWKFQGENAVWNPDYSCGHTWNNGFAHAVLCVGYNDDDPDNRYWIMVNSWGTASGGRPNGIFRLDMDMNYDCTFWDGANYYSFYWQTLDIDYAAIDICECDLNHDGSCNILDWPYFIEDWGRTDCPILSVAAVAEKVAPNNNLSGNPDAQTVEGVPLFRHWKVKKSLPDGNQPAVPPSETGIKKTAALVSDIEKAAETPAVSKSIWSSLDKLVLSDKENAVIQLEVLSDLSTDTLNESKNVEILWNSGKFAEAIEALQALETGGLTVAAGISWKSPKRVNGIEWIEDDIRIGARENIISSHLDFDAETGNLFAVLKFADTSSGDYYWSVNISTDGGQTWQETYAWLASSEIPDVSAAVVDDYLFIGYIPNVPQDQARIRRCTVSNGLIDSGYGWQTAFDKDVNIKEIALCTNTDTASLDNRLFYVAILSDFRLIFYWTDQDGGTGTLSWNEYVTGVDSAWKGLDATWNEGSYPSDPNAWFLFVSFVGYVLEGTETVNPIYVYRITDIGSELIAVDPDPYSDTPTGISAYDDHIITVFEYRDASSYQGIKYWISYDNGDNWSYGYIAPAQAGSFFWSPDVAARKGGGIAVVYQEEVGEPDPCWYRYRNYDGSIWWTDPEQFNEIDVFTGSLMEMEFLPPLPGNSYAYGAIWTSRSPHGAFFDRSDGGETDVCECDLNHDGSCNILDWPYFIEDWGRTDCTIP